jgi:hypothetical protein
MLTRSYPEGSDRIKDLLFTYLCTIIPFLIYICGIMWTLTAYYSITGGQPQFGRCF